MTATSRLGDGVYTLSSDYLILLMEFGFEHGINTTDMLQGSNLQPSVMMQPGTQIGHESFFKVVHNFYQQVKDMSLAAEYGRRMTLSKHGALGIAAQNSETMNDAATKIVRYIAIRNQLFTLKRHRDSKQRVLTVGAKVEDPVIPFICLAFLSSIETICRQMVSPQGDTVQSVIHMKGTCEDWLENNNSEQAVDEMTKTSRHLPGCSIVFGFDDYSLIWPSPVLDQTLPFFNPELEHLAEEACVEFLDNINRNESLVDQVIKLLQQSSGPMPTIDLIAQQVHMSTTTLQRKLKAEQTTFRKIKEQATYQQATSLLGESSLSIESIADQLGYSDASNFAKAFKSWSGQTPGEFRRAVDK